MQHTCTEVCQSPESRSLGHLPARMAWWPPGPQNYSKTPGLKEFPSSEAEVWSYRWCCWPLAIACWPHRALSCGSGSTAEANLYCKVWTCPTRSLQVLYSIGIHWHGHCIISSLWHLKILQSYSFCLHFFLFCTPHLCAFVFYFSDFSLIVPALPVHMLVPFCLLTILAVHVCLEFVLSNGTQLTNAAPCVSDIEELL